MSIKLGSKICKRQTSIYPIPFSHTTSHLSKSHSSKSHLSTLNSSTSKPLGTVSYEELWTLNVETYSYENGGWNYHVEVTPLEGSQDEVRDWINENVLDEKSFLYKHQPKEKVKEDWYKFKGNYELSPTKIINRIYKTVDHDRDSKRKSFNQLTI